MIHNNKEIRKLKKPRNFMADNNYKLHSISFKLTLLSCKSGKSCSGSYWTPQIKM